MDEKSIRLLEKTSGVNVCATKTATTEETAYKEVLAAKTYLTRKGVPAEGRWMICSPEFMATLMMDDHFIRQGDLSQQMKNAGATGAIAGFALFESGNTMFEDTKIVASKKTSTEFIAGHPNWCHRVQEWAVQVHAQDLSGSGKYIGASAVQGRKIFGMKISKHVPHDQGDLEGSGLDNSDKKATGGKYTMRWHTSYAQYLWNGDVMYGNPTERRYGPQKISFTSALAHEEWAKYAREVYGEQWKQVYQAALKRRIK